jgi:hypothetical protein
MIVRDDITAETYHPLPFSTADLQHLKKAIKDRVGKLLALDLGHTDTGVPFVSVMVPGDGFDDAPPCITRNEVTGLDGNSNLGWQIVRGGDGPLYEFATAQEVAEFLGSGGEE